MALSFVGHDERGLLRDIERKIGRTLAVVDDHPYQVALGAGASPSQGPHRGHGGGRRHGGGGNQRGNGRR
jgi:hypothetical protein